jgi:hypothetical protein
MPERWQDALASAEDRIEAINQHTGLAGRRGLIGMESTYALTLIVLAFADLSRAIALVGELAVDPSRSIPE